MSRAMVTIDHTGACGIHMNMLTIDSAAMMIAAARAHVALQKSPKATAVNNNPKYDVDRAPHPL